MIVSALFGRKRSKGFPKKNTMKILGRKILEYPLIACRDSKYIDKMYVSTDSEEIKTVSLQYGCEVIERPEELCSDEALLSDTIDHAHKLILKENPNLKFLIITMCNAPNITAEVIDRGIEMLNKNDNLDSIISVSRLDMFTPERARKDNGEGFLIPYIPFDKFTNEITCDRSSSAPTYFADGGVTIVRSISLMDMSQNLLPFQWMGKKIGYIEQLPGGADIDHPWQIGALKWWLKQNGFTE